MRNVNRTEKKYLLDIPEALKLQNQLGKVMSGDPHNGAQGYSVRSLYFDTPHERDFAEKLFGLDPRRKVRIRTYMPNHNDFALLELKQKQGDFQQKRSLTVNREETAQLILGKYDFLLERQENFAKEMFALLTINAYRPRTIVEYDRTAFIAKENKIRITFDRNIRANEFNYSLFESNLPLAPVFDPFNVVLEVKYDGFLLSYIKTILNMANKSSLSVSKYCLARSTTMAYQF